MLYVNGNSFGWGHIEISPILGKPRRGFTEINYADAMTPAKGVGLGSSVASTRRSAGAYEAEDPTLTGFFGDVSEFLTDLGAAGGGSITVPVFDIVVVFANPNEGVHTATLHDCRVIGRSNAYTAGPDLLMRSVTLSCMRISEDGMTLYEQTDLPVG